MPWVSLKDKPVPQNENLRLLLYSLPTAYSEPRMFYAQWHDQMKSFITVSDLGFDGDAAAVAQKDMIKEYSHWMYMPRKPRR